MPVLSGARRRPRAGGRAAFTLVELLVAASLSALAVAALCATLMAGVNAMDRIASVHGPTVAAFLALARMERDISGALDIPSLAFEGGPDRIAFASVLREEAANGSVAERLGQVAYWAGGTGNAELLRSSRPYPDEAGSGTAPERVLDGLVRLRFSYLARGREGARGDGWRDAWAPADPVAPAPAKAGRAEPYLPLAVRVTLSVRDGGRTFDVTRTVNAAPMR